MDLKKWIGLWMSRYIVSKNPLDMIVFFDRLNSSICVIRAKLTDNGRYYNTEDIRGVMCKSGQKPFPELILKKV